MVTYFAIRNNINDPKLGLEEKLKQCRALANYYQLSDLENGILYFNGKRINYEEFINNNSIVEENVEKTHADNINMYIDDIEIDLL